MRLRAFTLVPAVSASVLLVLSGCVATDASPPERDTSLGHFYGQTLEFAACEAPAQAPGLPPPDVAAECATLEVPLDYAIPSGDTARIALLRVAARGDDVTGSVVVNPGGPGMSGVAFAPTLALAWADSPVTEKFDIVGFDPRGVGASTPTIDCYTDAERDADAKFTSYDSGAEDWTEDETRDLAEQCAERSGGEHVLAAVGTRDVARDMDVLREALGDEQLSFAGLSYGTRLGAVYAEMFPDNVRALVLDGALDPGMSTHDLRVQQFEGIGRSFDQMAKFCATQTDCPLGTDAAAATTEFQNLVQPLVESPAPATDDRDLTFIGALSGVIVGLYSDAAWPIVLEGISELKAGNGAPLLALRDALQVRAADGTSSNDLESLLAINCLDEDRHTPEQETALKRAVFDAAAFIDPGTVVENSRNGCENWSVEPTLNPLLADEPDGLADTLVVSVTGDGITPHAGGIALAEALGGSLLTVEGEQHGASLAGNACVDEIVAVYLVDLESPAPDARCHLAAAPRP
ncbi:hypothetical protein CH305_21030 [Rhodococcus sp. 15-649-2-2]|uniref:alpha/beta hydrolase n=1 Tax=Rhodococcus sp. 15-649-2-2 TaxID=2023140 RepID=UPI000B9B5346|nr:alpha/beta hydrolase [Rhodococcus sp. 15-649-2-2]OZE74189.1 hypothetical protein CH305_21030 [Rhodococcus sp. 15-649-2-2]